MKPHNLSWLALSEIRPVGWQPHDGNRTNNHDNNKKENEFPVTLPRFFHGYRFSALRTIVAISFKGRTAADTGKFSFHLLVFHS